MRILVTGGTGFLGKRLVQQLAAAGHRVTVLARRVQDDLPAGVAFVSGDVRDPSALAPAFRNIDTVFHLAVTLDEADPALRDINVTGTANVITCCRTHKVKQLVYMSSSGVLGETHVPAREDFPYRPRTTYEESKRESEEMIRKSGVPYTIIRTTIIIGPSLIWMKIFEAAKRGYPIIGSGKNYFHLVAADDVVRLLVLVAGNKKALNQIFHVASPDTPTYEEVYRMICETLKCPMPAKHISTTIAYLMSSVHTTGRRLRGKQPSLTMMKSSIDRLVRNRIISTEKAQRVLGFTPRTTTRVALQEALTYMKIARLGYSDYDLSALHTTHRGPYRPAARRTRR